MENFSNGSFLLTKLEELFLIRKNLQPSELVENFEVIIYSRYHSDLDKETANEIFEWYEDRFPGDDEAVCLEIECLKINAFLASLICGLDDGYFSEDDDEENELNLA